MEDLHGPLTARRDEEPERAQGRAGFQPALVAKPPSELSFCSLWSAHQAGKMPALPCSSWPTSGAGVGRFRFGAPVRAAHVTPGLDFNQRGSLAGAIEPRLLTTRVKTAAGR